MGTGSVSQLHHVRGEEPGRQRCSHTGDMGTGSVSQLHHVRGEEQAVRGVLTLGTRGEGQSHSSVMWEVRSQASSSQSLKYSHTGRAVTWPELSSNVRTERNRSLSLLMCLSRPEARNGLIYRHLSGNAIINRHLSQRLLHYKARLQDKTTG